MPSIIVPWILFSIIVGFLGRRLRFGFWGYFFVSILLTPVIGLLMLIAAVPTKAMRKSMMEKARKRGYNGAGSRP
jgi:hypothetical protein